MPLYLYENLVTGRMEEIIRPVSLRDAVPAQLRRVMTCPTVLRDNPLRPEVQRDCASGVLNGLREVESQHGTAALERETGFSAKEMKRIWERPLPPEKREEGVVYG